MKPAQRSLDAELRGEHAAGNFDDRRPSSLEVDAKASRGVPRQHMAMKRKSFRWAAKERLSRSMWGMMGQENTMVQSDSP